jgi:hypothetical protein
VAVAPSAGAGPGARRDAPTGVDPQLRDPAGDPASHAANGQLKVPGGNKQIDYDEIAIRQFRQQILPSGMPTTTVWSYGSVTSPATSNFPAFTIEAKWTAPVRVKWINQLVDANGNYLPHLLPIDQTLHWANPPGGPGGTAQEAFDPRPYQGPVPILTHLHGGHSTQESDGYPQGLVPARGQQPPRPAMPAPARSTTSSRPRPRTCTG